MTGAIGSQRAQPFSGVVRFIAMYAAHLRESTMDHAVIAEVLRFWFGALTPKQWFAKDAALDEEIRNRFGRLYERVAHEPVGHWLDSPEGALAAVLVLDQFPRNIYRDDARAFASDAMALDIARRAITLGHDKRLDAKQRKFLYMPFMHAESAAAQTRALELFESLGEAESIAYAKLHKAIVDRFGRFPHRNAVLGRASTPAEEDFLRQPNSSF
jgi:uncharacterized protein (DUF924 family)